MEYTDAEKQIARDILTQPTTLAFLKKVLIEPREVMHPELVTLKTNEELGEMVRADVLADEKIKRRFGELQKLGQAKATGTAPVAPK